MIRSSSAGTSEFSRTGATGDPCQDGVRDKPRGLAPERQNAGHHFVENDAKGEQVGARVEFFSPNLFGRHVGHGADGCSGISAQIPVRDIGQVVGPAESGRATLAVGASLGKAEVENLYLFALG